MITFTILLSLVAACTCGSAFAIINDDRSTDRMLHWVETIALPILTAITVIGGTVSLWLFTGLSFSDIG